MAQDTTPFPTPTPRAAEGGFGAEHETGSERLTRSDLPAGGMPSAEGGATPQGDEMFTRVVQGAHQTIDRLADTAAPHVHRLSEGLETRTDQVRELADEWTGSLRATVRENPLAAVATALAIGMLIARLSR